MNYANDRVCVNEKGEGEGEGGGFGGSYNTSGDPRNGGDGEATDNEVLFRVSFFNLILLRVEHMLTLLTSRC